MKTSKRLAVFVSLVVISSFLFGTMVSASSDKNPFNLIWGAIFDLQTQIDEIEASAGSTRIVYQGTIDLSSSGDVIKVVTHDLTAEYHYALINIPEVELDDMPQVEVYVKLYDQSHVTDDLWRNADTLIIASDHSVVVYDEQSVLINYKTSFSPDGHTTTWISGEYKIVVVK